MRSKRKTSPPSAQWIFFDLDGTLIDTLPAMYRAHLAFLKRFKIQGHKKKEFERLNGPSLLEVVQFLKVKYDLSASDKQLLSLYRKEILNAYAKGVRLHSGVRSLLKSLRQHNFQLALVTSAYRQLGRKILKQQGLSQFFDFCVFGDEVKKSKPHPAIYRLAIKKSNSEKSSILVVEDSKNGIRAARAAGLFVVGVSHSLSRQSLKQSGADRSISNLKDLLKIV